MHRNTNKEMAALYLGRAAGKGYLLKSRRTNEWVRAHEECEFFINLEYKEVKQPNVVYFAVDSHGKIDLNTMSLEKKYILEIIEKIGNHKSFVKMVEEVENDND